MKKFKYTNEHLDFLRTGYLSMNVRDLTRAFNRKFKLQKTRTAINSALKNHNIKCGRAHKDRLIDQYRNRLFNPEQVEFLRKEYSGRSVAELMSVFNERFGTDMTWKQIKSAVKNRGITSGRTGHFPKGHKPWNHGTKGQGLTGPNKGSFKKGSVPSNRKPIGSERICSKDGYIYIKIAEEDPYTGFSTRYKPKHVHNWEQENGPVPDGMCLIFRDGDKTNCDPENMILVSRSELLMLNKIGYKDAPDEIKSSILALAKLNIGIFSNEKSMHRV